MGELYHWGIPGMKWGVRRYQNKDGSLTPAGKRRDRKANKDAAKLAKAFETHLDAYNDASRSTKRYYHVDERGTNSYGEDGKPRFDASRGITIQNTKKVAVSRATMDSYHQMKQLMSKKYDDVVSKAEYDVETGKACIKVQLSKYGNTYVSEINKDYGEWTQPVEFITYTKDQ